MSETVEPDAHGSYDDVPDEFVATVLNVPLRLTSESEVLERPPIPAAAPGRGRHRKPDPVGEQLQDIPVPATHPVQASHRDWQVMPSDESTVRYSHTQHALPESHWIATVKVGSISAVIVFACAAIALVFLARLP